MKKHRRALIVILTVFMFITQQGCAAKTVEPVSRQNFFFDTVCSIAVYDMDKMSEENANKAIQNAFALCSRYESLLFITVNSRKEDLISRLEEFPICGIFTLRSRRSPQRDP